MGLSGTRNREAHQNVKPALQKQPKSLQAGEGVPSGDSPWGGWEKERVCQSVLSSLNEERYQNLHVVC